MLILFPSIRDLEKLLKKPSKYIFFSILTSESENIGFLHVCMYVLNKRINTLKNRNFGDIFADLPTY